jgi:hypothetical protein
MIGLRKVNNHELGLRFVNEKLTAVLPPGWYLVRKLLGERIDVVSEKDVFVRHQEFDQILRSGLLADYCETIDLKDGERALLWVDDRFSAVLPPGKYAVWKRLRKVAIERHLVAEPPFEHRLLYQIAGHPTGEAALQSVTIEAGECCLYFQNGRFVKELSPGFYAFWKGLAGIKLHRVNLREKTLDLSGQEIITADKVTLRLNALITYRVVNAWQSFQVAENPEQSLYREGQLLLREVVGCRKLDEILDNKDSLTGLIADRLQEKAQMLGVTIVGFGVKDVILPGDMRELLNRVVQAQKEAEATQISRREETAAIRSQCNTAKLLESNPTLMRMRELEILERIARDSKLNLILGEKGLAEKVVNML